MPSIVKHIKKLVKPIQGYASSKRFGLVGGVLAVINCTVPVSPAL